MRGIVESIRRRRNSGRVVLSHLFAVSIDVARNAKFVNYGICEDEVKKLKGSKLLHGLLDEKMVEAIGERLAKRGGSEFGTKEMVDGMVSAKVGDEDYFSVPLIMCSYDKKAPIVCVGPFWGDWYLSYASGVAYLVHEEVLSSGTRLDAVEFDGGSSKFLQITGVFSNRTAKRVDTIPGYQYNAIQNIFYPAAHFPDCEDLCCKEEFSEAPPCATCFCGDSDGCKFLPLISNARVVTDLSDIPLNTRVFLKAADGSHFDPNERDNDLHSCQRIICAFIEESQYARWFCNMRQQIARPHLKRLQRVPIIRKRSRTFYGLPLYRKTSYDHDLQENSEDPAAAMKSAFDLYVNAGVTRGWYKLNGSRKPESVSNRGLTLVRSFKNLHRFAHPPFAQNIRLPGYPSPPFELEYEVIRKAQPNEDGDNSENADNPEEGMDTAEQMDSVDVEEMGEKRVRGEKGARKHVYFKHRKVEDAGKRMLARIFSAEMAELPSEVSLTYYCVEIDLVGCIRERLMREKLLSGEKVLDDSLGGGRVGVGQSLVGFPVIYSGGNTFCVGPLWGEWFLRLEDGVPSIWHGDLLGSQLFLFKETDKNDVLCLSTSAENGECDWKAPCDGCTQPKNLFDFSRNTIQCHVSECQFHRAIRSCPLLKPLSRPVISVANLLNRFQHASQNPSSPTEADVD